MHSTEPLVLVSLIVGFLVLIAVALVLIGTVRRKGRFGINTDIPFCPRCGEKVSAVRVPQSMNHFLWGGLLVSAVVRLISGEMNCRQRRDWSGFVNKAIGPIFSILGR